MEVARTPPNRTPSGADVWLSLPAGGPRPPDRTREARGGASAGVARRRRGWRATAPVGLVVLAAVVAAALQLTHRGPGGSWSAAPADRSLDVPTLLPVAETEPVPHVGDAADDPAIWPDPRDPARSTIIGTDKDGGLAVYDLSGRELQYLPDGRLNNVDLRSAFPLGRRRGRAGRGEQRLGQHRRALPGSTSGRAGSPWSDRSPSASPSTGCACTAAHARVTSTSSSAAATRIRRPVATRASGQPRGCAEPAQVRGRHPGGGMRGG